MRPGQALLSATLLATALLTGCKVATQTDLRFDAGPMTRARAITMRVEVRDRAGNVVFMLERPLSGPQALPWPSTLPLVPMSDHSSFSVVAELLDASGQVFSVQRVRSGFVERERHVIEVFFQDVCIGILCTVDTTCLSAACVQSEQTLNPGGEASRTDRQPGVCSGGYCYEHPRPGPIYFNDACVGEDEDPVEFIVGSLGQAVLRRQGDIWVQETTPATSALGSVECWDQRAIAVGRSGTIVVRDAMGSWQREESGVTEHLAGVSGAAPEDAWVVGDSGVVLRRTPAGWERLDAGTVDLLTDVWSPRREEAWIVAAPALLHYRDGAWETVASPGDGASAVAGRDGELLSIGHVPGDAEVYRREADGWTPVDVSYHINLTALDISDDGTAAVAGGRGAEIVRPPGGAFLLASPGSGINLRGAAAGSGRAIFVGRDFISRWEAEGQRVVESVALSRAHLHGVAHSTAEEVGALAVGDDGTVLRRASVGVWRWEPVLEREATLTASLRAVTATGGGWVIAGDGVLVERPYGAEPSFTTVRPTAEPLLALANDGSRIVAVGATGTILERTGPGEWVPFTDRFPAPSELTAAAWERPDTLLVGTADGEIWRHDGAWLRVADLGAPIRCLRDVGDGVLACSRTVERVTAMGTTEEWGAVPARALDIAPGPRPIVVAGDLWDPRGGTYTRRFLGTFEAASVGARETLFVGQVGVIARSE